MKKKEEILSSHKLNVVDVVEKETGFSHTGVRRLRVQFGYEGCPTMTEQHTAHLTDLNYLMEKYKPDELAAYIAARASFRQEILGHDFASEYSLQEGKNLVYKLRRAFEDLPEDIKKHFKSPLDFIKFMDNPNNADKAVALGILTRKQLDDVKDPSKPGPAPQPAPDSDDKKT